MRAVAVVCACLLTACSTQAVRCERHLIPINIPRQPIADAPAPGQPEGASANARSASKPAAAMPENRTGAESAARKHPASTTDEGGPP